MSKEAMYEKQNRVKFRLSTVLGIIGNVAGLVTAVAGLFFNNDGVVLAGISTMLITTTACYIADSTPDGKDDQPPDTFKGVF